MTRLQEGSIYKLISILSLDVAAGSLAGGVLVTRLLKVEMPTAWYILLPLCVWLIYTLDHLLDSRRLGAKAHTARHLFHHLHFRKIGLFWSVLAAGGFAAALICLPLEGIYFGLVMGLGVILHLGLVSLVGGKTSPLLVKEGGVALIYTFGIWGMPFVLHMEAVETSHLLMMAQFGLLALVNLLEFSLFERETDELDGQSSLVRAIGARKTSVLLGFLLMLNLVLAIGVFIVDFSQPTILYQGILLLMALLLGLILFRKNYFAHSDRYRAWGDAVFLLPALSLLF
ncbi:MAG: hypothetical protein H6581_29270 [Bacteroidia bacterium]|nr:hypothetical protein [Bacteroidia bacterium]